MATKTTTKKSTTKAGTSKAGTSKASANPIDDNFAIAVGTFEVSTADVKGVVADSAYATVGAGDLAVSVARDLPGRLDTLRKDQLTFAKEAPAKAQTFVKEAPGKLQTQIDSQIATVRDEVNAYATRGRKLVGSVTDSTSTKKAVSQSETARSQVKGAVTSIRKAVEQSQNAARTAVGRIGTRR